MKNQKERSLAYTLAKKLDKQQLAAVGGGAGQLKLSAHPTGKISGTNGSWDSSLDITADW